MKKPTRRTFGRWIGAFAVTAAGKSLFPKPALGGGAKPRAVVIGGGAAGATAARRLAEDFKGIDVTLVEANRSYTSCFFFNRYVGGLRTLDSVTHDYRKLSSAFGIDTIHAEAAGIDAARKTVALKGGDTLSYDRLVVAAGIDFKHGLIEGYDETVAETLTHAYKADRQVAVLKRQLDAMKDGGLFIITAPRRPYRCPPAPYERASMAAYYLKKAKPRSKILILDAKDEFPMSETLTEVWDRFYPGMIEWVPAEFGGRLRAVDAKTRTLITDDEKFIADVANVIPDQQAGRIAQSAGLADKTGWCPVNPQTFESNLVPGIHVIGDAIDPGDMAKSAYSANSQARICADAVGAALTGGAPKPGKLENICYFLAARDHGLMTGGTYRTKDGKIAGVTGSISQVGEDDPTRKTTADQGDAWYDTVIREMFG